MPEHRVGANAVRSQRSSDAMKAQVLLCIVVLAATGGLQMVRADEAAVQVDTSGLKPIGPDWVGEDPYRGEKRAVEIGSMAYNNNCARCHGLEVKSGGFNPDLRYLPTGSEGDAIFLMRMQNGAQENGRILMPKFDGILPQEALWAIRTYVEVKHVDE